MIRKFLAAAVGLVCLVATPAAVLAQNIPIPNGDFSAPGNVGTFGGILGSGGPTPIGTGPWNGTFSGVLGLLLGPTLSISTTGGFGGVGGAATISGIAAVNVLGPVNNSGFFTDSTATAYLPNTVYQLTTAVNVSSLLTLGALTSSGVGIGLLDGSGATLASTTTGSNQSISLSLLSGNTYLLTLNFLTGSTAPTGNIGIKLFDSPNAVATAGLFSTAIFSNVSLQALPEPQPMALVGIGLVGLAGLGLLRHRHLIAR